MSIVFLRSGGVFSGTGWEPANRGRTIASRRETSPPGLCGLRVKLSPRRSCEDVRVVELEAGPHEAVDEVDRRAASSARLRVSTISFTPWLSKTSSPSSESRRTPCCRIAGAATAADREAQAVLGLGVLGQQFLHFLRGERVSETLAFSWN